MIQNANGKVKFYNVVRGYGIITLDDGRDLFVHVSTINASGYTLERHAPVVCNAIETSRGWQVTELLSVKPAVRDVSTGWELGRVKFYDVDKGYGYIQLSSGGDVFVHAVVVKRRTGRTHLRAGDPVRVFTITGPRGPRVEDMECLTSPTP